MIGGGCGGLWEQPRRRVEVVQATSGGGHSHFLLMNLSVGVFMELWNLGEKEMGNGEVKKKKRLLVSSR